MGYNMVNKNTNNREKTDGEKYNESLSIVVWKDMYGTWHISQATSEKILVDAFINSGRAKGENYEIFCGSDYTKAVKYKKEMQSKDVRKN